MAVGTVYDPQRREIERVERRDDRRVWLTVQSLAQTRHPLPEGTAAEVRWRWAPGTTVWIDGRLHAELGADRTWRLADDAVPA